MRVPNEVIDEWKLNSDHGDITDICAQSGYSRYRVSKVVQSGEGDEEVVKAVIDFYNKKKESISSLVQTIKKAS